jgi:integrase
MVRKLRPASGPGHNLVEDNILVPAEIGKLLEAADDRWRLIIKTGILSGLREGELLGLKWTDIDWTSGTLYVRRTYSTGRFSEPKSKASRRRVPIPAELLTELKRWKLACPIGKHELVFPSGAGNPENHGNLLRRGFYPALRRAGLRQIRFHDLRHTYASLLIANGEKPKLIQALLGHSSIKITFDVYGHLLPDADDGVADRLAGLAPGSKGGY